VILAVVLLHPVTVEVNVNVTLPVATVVTNPVLSTVATLVSLLVQVPPEFGVRFIVAPMQIPVDGAFITGRSFTVMLAVVLLQPVAVDVNVKVTVPAATVVTNPALSTVATFVSLLVQVPPEFGVRFIVAPTQILEDGTLITGKSFTVILAVVLLHPVDVEVNVKVTVPAATVVTNPVLSTVATFVSLLVQVPPVFGVRFIVEPTQILEDGALITGKSFTAMVAVVLLHPVAVEANVKVTVPAATVVTNPVSSMVATLVSLLVQVPPVFGVRFIVEPTQILVDGALITGRSFTVMLAVVLLHPDIVPV
jgi:hypothetical protein